MFLIPTVELGVPEASVTPVPDGETDQVIGFAEADVLILKTLVPVVKLLVLPTSKQLALAITGAIATGEANARLIWY